MCERHRVVIEGIERFCVGVLQSVSAKKTGKHKIVKRETRTFILQGCLSSGVRPSVDQVTGARS